MLNNIGTSKTSKYKENKQSNIKETNTLDNKHRTFVKYFNDKRNDKENMSNEIKNITNKINELDINKNNFTLDDIKVRAELLDKKEKLEQQNKQINYEEMDYYDNAGDLLTDYYESREKSAEEPVKEKKNILDFLCTKKEKEQDKDKQIIDKTANRANLFEKYCQRIDGIRIKQDDGSNRIKYCNECKIEKILNMVESAYICQFCGDSEIIILDEDRQIKDYSPYRRLNHFREWLNQFQAKQSPDIPEQIFIDIVKELNKNRITDLSVLNKKNMKTILKKLDYNIYYEHVAYIINKLNNLPPPKITRDMEKLFISMFFQIQEPWETYKQPDRKNFLSYSYVLHKFCELLELDHLLDCFPLHKDPDKIMENDMIWDKICKYLNWEYISSFK
jgi:predicted transposase YbfD/YdcC